MMDFKEYTYEAILQRMIDRVKAKHPDLDTREGSMIFDSLAPAAMEVAIAYVNLGVISNESFVTTASREYLYILCQEMGLDTDQFDATFSIHKAQFNVEVPIGSRWNLGLYNYKVIKALPDEDGFKTYEVGCETAGSAPNPVTGTLTPITDNPTGLNHAELVGVIIEGENETPDDEIRQAYINYVNKTGTDGNVRQYLQWCDEYDGIGHAKVFPLWNGANTVKVSILSSSNRKASTELIQEFQKYLDPGTTGMGDGVAPIGAFVTVTTAEEVPVNFTADITLAPGASDTEAKINKNLSNYLAEMAYTRSKVAYLNLAAVILNTEGVETVSSLLVNDGDFDLEFTAEQIPVLGTTEWVVVA